MSEGFVCLTVWQELMLTTTLSMRLTIQSHHSILMHFKPPYFDFDHLLLASRLDVFSL